jgi:hypothetical protein
VISKQLAVVSNQSQALLEESDVLLTAAEEFVEAVRRSKKMEQKEKIVRTLELAMRKAFKEQGRIFIRNFRAKLRTYFAEGFEGHSAFLNTPLKESITPTDWLVVWIETIEKTAKLFSVPIDQAVQAALVLGAATTIGETGLKISFSLQNPRAVSYLQDYGAKLVAGVDDTTRKQLQTIITQAVNDGWSYDRTAQAIIDKFDDFAVGRPQAHIDSRAHLVAVTETGNAYTEGRLQAAQQLQAAGLDMEKAWDTVGDDKVSDGCRNNAAVGWITLDDAFPSGHQRPLRFPGCRCDLMTRVKEQ